MNKCRKWDIDASGLCVQDILDMTGIIHKCDLLDICSCEFGQADRQRNKPEYGCLESHISPTACLHQM